jgi:hypothetical protein
MVRARKEAEEKHKEHLRRVEEERILKQRERN